MAMSEVTPRSALRTINADQDTLGALKNKQATKSGNVAPVSSLFKKPLQTFGVANTGKTLLNIHTDSACEQKVQTKEKVITRPPEPVPEKEQLKTFDPSEDLRMPKIDKALYEVVEKIRNWRPPCFFGVARADSDDEEEDEIRGMKDYPLVEPPEEPVFGLMDLSDIEIPETVHLPMVDIEDLPIPFLDDSLDIEPNMGTLEIWETSTPASLSPRLPHSITSSPCSPVSHVSYHDNSSGL